MGISGLKNLLSLNYSLIIPKKLFFVNCFAKNNLTFRKKEVLIPTKEQVSEIGTLTIA
jgi:hypothetical protein